VINRFIRVVDGLYRGSAPSVKDVVNLNKLYGVNKIVSLDQLAGNRINKICKLLGIKHIIIPMNGAKSSIINLLSHDIKKLLLNDGPTFVHCQEGKDRTGFIIALFKCKYMGVSLEDALAEAIGLGFGYGIDPLFTKLYIGILKKLCVDNNSADTTIVDNEREYMQDGRSSALDHADRGSFAPYMSITRQFPYDPPYNYVYDQEPTRENFRQPIEPNEPHGELPMVGQYDNASGVKGVGPVEIGTGFLNS